MVRGSNPGGVEVFRNGPEAHPTFSTMGAGRLSPGVAMSTHSLLGPNLKKKQVHFHPTFCVFTACYRVKCAVIRLLHFFIFRQLRYV
jgi:hypothetical protein